MRLVIVLTVMFVKVLVFMDGLLSQVSLTAFEMAMAEPTGATKLSALSPHSEIRAVPVESFTLSVSSESGWFV